MRAVLFAFLFITPAQAAMRTAPRPLRIAPIVPSGGISGVQLAQVVPQLGATLKNPQGYLQAISQRYNTDADYDAPADLGEGDHGEVRSGRLDRLPVAVKIPYLDPGGMMAHEGAVSARLHAAGGGELFLEAAHDAALNVLVMEKLGDGEHLWDWLEAREDRGISERTFRRIERQLRRGLEVLQTAGLVHSDLKPDNIIIGPRAGVKIVDFGLAADVGAYPPYPNYSGWRGGHHDFTSPNQLSNGPAAYADDAHSVAVVLKRLRRRVRP